MTSGPVSLDELAAHPEQARNVPPQVAAALLAAVAGLQTLLLARLLSQVSADGQGEAPAEDRLLTIPEVADRLGVPNSYAYELARRGALPTVRVGVKYVRVPRAAFQRWLAERQQLDTGGAPPHSRRRRG